MIRSWWAGILMITGLILLGLCAAVHGDRDASVLALVDRASALGDRSLESCPAYLISPEKAILVVDAESAADMPLLEASVRLPAPERPLWVTAAPIPEETVRRLGLDVLFEEGVNTVFSATEDAAYGLLAEGYFVVGMEFVPLRQMQPEAWRRLMTEDLLQDRPLHGRRARFLRSVADSVDTLRLKDILHFLQYDDANSRYRSRFQARPETRQEVVPFLEDMFASYLGPYGGVFGQQSYLKKLGGDFACTGEFPCDTVFTNVIATKPGRKTSAHYIICAHYDAIATHTPGWSEEWYMEGVPAPGADDNGTGVAAVLESARLLSGLDLDVGVKFILFSGEELGLLGSDHYVNNLAPDDSIIGVINFDMVGYVDQEPILEIVYDWQSRWISDQIADVGRVLGLESETELVNLSGIANSDHSSFWVNSIPANMIIEELEDLGYSKGAPVNPNYHTLGDTLGLLDMRLAGDAVRVVVGMMSRFAQIPEDTLSDIWLTEGSAELGWPGRRVGQPPVAGDSLSVELRALNVGAAMKEAEPYTFEIWQGGRGSGTLIHEATEMVELLEGQHTYITSGWKTSPDSYGDVTFTFVLMPMEGDVESDLTNNVVEVVLAIMPVTSMLRDVHVTPNPVSFSEAEPKLRFEILHPEGDFNAVMDVWVFDILGTVIGRASLENTPLVHDFDAGANAVDLTRVVSRDIAPGLYICRMRLRLLGEPGTFDTRFKFAVDR